MGQSAAEWECRACGWFGSTLGGEIFVLGDSDGYLYLTCPHCYTVLSPGLGLIKQIDKGKEPPVV